MSSTKTDPVATKIEAEFDKLDLDRDGHLDWSDYQTLIDRYKKASRVGDNDRRIRALRAFYEVHWLELLRHAGIDGDRLSKSEFVDATRRATADTSRLDLTEAGGHFIFDLIDANGDGQISKEELTRYLQGVWQIKESDGVYDFDALDRDKNQLISREEFIGGIHDHLEV